MSKRCLAVFFLFPVWLMAQDRAATPLTLAEAEQIALRNHPRLAEAQNNARAASERTVQAKSAYYPTINGEITGSQGYNGSRIGAGNLSASRLFDRAGQGVQVNQLVTDLGRTQNLVASAKLQGRAADQQTEATRLDILLGVHRAYFEVLQAQNLVHVAEQTVAARQTLVDQASALAKAQLKSQVDVSFAQVSLSEAKLQLIRAEDAQKQAAADLTRALGEDRPVDYALSESDSLPPMPPSVEPLVTDAVNHRPELAALRLSLEAAKKFESAERDLARPNLSLVAVGGALPYINPPNNQTIPLGYEGVALNLEIPIFNGHLFSARREEAHYRALAANQHLRDVMQQLERDVRTAWAAAATASQRIPITEDLVKQAQLSLDLAQGRYNIGLSSIVEITQAQLSLAQARIENVNARYDYLGTIAVLQYTIGSLQ
jgi:outer membrane protein